MEEQTSSPVCIAHMGQIHNQRCSSSVGKYPAVLSQIIPGQR